MRESLSDRIDRVWATRRFARSRIPTRAAAQTKRIRRRATLRSSGDFSSWNSRILFASRRTGGVRASAKAAGADDLFEIRMEFCHRNRGCSIHCGTMRIRIFMKAASMILAADGDRGDLAHSNLLCGRGQRPRLQKCV